MMYTVGEMAKILGVPASTLRYYDKEGMLPFVERTSGDIRMFKEQDYEWLKLLSVWKKQEDLIAKQTVEHILGIDRKKEEEKRQKEQEQQLQNFKICSLSVTSSFLMITPGRLARSLPFSGLRIVAITRQPLSEKKFVVSLPIPDDGPVIKIVFIFYSTFLNIVCLGCFCLYFMVVCILSKLQIYIIWVKWNVK